MKSTEVRWSLATSRTLLAHEGAALVGGGRMVSRPTCSPTGEEAGRQGDGVWAGNMVCCTPAGLDTMTSTQSEGEAGRRAGGEKGELLPTFLLFHWPRARGGCTVGQPCCHPSPWCGREAGSKGEGRVKSCSGGGDILPLRRLAAN